MVVGFVLDLKEYVMVEIIVVDLEVLVEMEVMEGDIIGTEQIG
jgi:hypothetical protein